MDIKKSAAVLCKHMAFTIRGARTLSNKSSKQDL
jgi:hypothetical protein